MRDQSPNAGVIAPPPLLYLGGLLVGYACHWISAWQPFLHARFLGILLVAFGVAVALWAVGTMARAKTPVDPSRTPTQLVRSGPFRWSRNPIYLAMTVASVGVAFALNNGWMVLWLIPVLVAVHYGVIRREERFLAAKFGDPYREYMGTVRRWL